LSPDKRVPHAQLAWPPTKEDMQRLYVDEKLSAAKIAKIYGRNTKNPRSGAFLILYYLRKNGIDRRDRIEELQKETEVTIAAWTEKNPKQENPDMELEKSAVLELLRNEGLSIEHLDEETKGRVRAVMEYLHWAREVSMTDIAELIGSKTSGYVSWLFKKIEVKARDFEVARLKGIADARKHGRNPFDGTEEDKAYLLGLRYGDLHAYRPFGDAVAVSTSTTHPAMYQLFEALFGPYGPLYRSPRYKKDNGSYEWNIQATLDSSFSFLLQPLDWTLKWVEGSESLTFAFLSGFLDAEGSIVITKDQGGKVALFVDYSNSDKSLLEWIKQQIESKGFYCSLRLNKPEGYVTKKWGIIHRKDYWQLSSYGMDRIQRLIQKLAPRHSEKVRRKEIAMTVKKGQDYASIFETVRDLRATIKREVEDSKKEAEKLFKERHHAFEPESPDGSSLGAEKK
jgi:LAGLIDADG DNA endonuclease family protein